VDSNLGSEGNEVSMRFAIAGLYRSGRVETDGIVFIGTNAVEAKGDTLGVGTVGI
jgi:hypothetical protein